MSFKSLQSVCTSIYDSTRTPVQQKRSFSLPVCVFFSFPSFYRIPQNLVAPADLAAAFNEFAWLVDAEVPNYVEAWEDGNHSLAETEAELARLASVRAAVSVKCEGLVSFRLAVVDCSGAQSWLVEKATALRMALLCWQADRWHAANVAAVEQFESIVARLHHVR